MLNPGSCIIFIANTGLCCPGDRQGQEMDKVKLHRRACPKAFVSEGINIPHWEGGQTKHTSHLTASKGRGLSVHDGDNFCTGGSKGI